MDARELLLTDHRLVRAAEYVRMSTAMQNYSVPAQQAVIRQYAADHGMTVIRSYIDAGRSGLALHNREALVALLTDVQEGRADFDVILVYDVSRWGRFQDVDESAYYEYLCRKANVQVEYCAEPFRNDGGPLTSILKSIKRTMAAEYSREQSARVHRAIHSVAARGYFSGGSPGFGFRRMLIGSKGEEKGLLQSGEISLSRQDHVILVPAPAEEVKTVRRIFRLYVQREMSPQAIADILNKERTCDRSWSLQKIHGLLRNERYIGTSIYNKSRRFLRAPRTANRPEDWVRVPRAYKPIVSTELFTAAQRRLESRKHRKYTEQQLLDRLRYLLKEHGYLSKWLVDRDAHPMHPTYCRAFGGMQSAYERIGYVPSRVRPDRGRWDTALTVMLGLGDALVAAFRAMGKCASRHGSRREVSVDGNPLLAILVAYYMPTASRRLPSWRVSNKRSHTPAWTLLARMNGTNSEPLDLYLLPEPFAHGVSIRLHNEAFDELRAYWCSGVDEIVARIATSEARPRLSSA